jgi:GrpB-like predicted nucleotidyltransferase (UPF0157 family)
VSGRPRLVDHDPRWPALFERLRETLTAALSGRILHVHHVGSTSVPGLRAKPIMDVLVGVPDLEASLACVPTLAELGFVYGADDELPDRHYFRGSRGGLRTHHLSLAEPRSTHYRDTLAFRDALRGSRELAREYERLKEELVARHRPGDLFHLGKTEFVARVLREVAPGDAP